MKKSHHKSATASFAVPPAKYVCSIAITAVTFVMAFVGTWAEGAEVQSVSRIAFGPQDTLFVADWKGAQVLAVTLPPAEDTSSAPYNLTDFEGALTKVLGTADLRVEDLRARPASNEAYVALSVGPTRRPAIVQVQSNGAVKVLDLKALKTQEAELKDVIDWNYQFWDKTPERSFTVTDMQFHEGKLYVAGLSNQNFASTLRVLDYPFTGKQSMASVQIYHATHDQMETRAPIREMTFAKLEGKDYLVAAYMCTPLVTIPVDAIQDGAHITGKTIAELGYGNTPAGMLTFTANEEGKEVNYLIVTNLERNAEMIPMDQVEAANRKDGMSKQVPMGLIGGITPTQTPFAGVYRIDNLSPKYFVALRRDLATGKSQLVTYDKNLRLRLSDFVSEYNFPGYVYKGKLQVEVFKPVEDALKKEEGFAVTPDLEVNGPFPPK